MRRRGFTLIEIVVAIGIFSAVLALAMQAYMGFYKSQGTTVGAAMLKTASEQALKRMFFEISQSRKLLESLSTDTGTNIGAQYVALFNLPLSGPFVPISQTVYPVIRVNGGLGQKGTPGASAPGELDPTTVGNTLLFVRQVDVLHMSDPDVGISTGSGPLLQSSNAPYFLPVYRFILYYIVAPTMLKGYPPFTGQGVPFNGGTVTKTYQLARWESDPYVDKNEFTTMVSHMALLPSATTSFTATQVMWNHVVANGVVEMWDSGASTAATAFYKLDASGNVVQDTAPAVSQHSVTFAIAPELAAQYGLTMLSFNTGPSFAPVGLTVPEFADFNSADATYPPTPFGFETAIVGPNSARSVLLHLALACRLTMTKHVFGVENQEVVRVTDN